MTQAPNRRPSEALLAFREPDRRAEYLVHDLRRLLTSAYGRCARLHQQLDAGSPAAAEAAELAALLDWGAALAEPTDPGKSTQDLTDFLIDVGPKLRRILEPDTRLEIRFSEQDKLVCRFHGPALERVLMNLCAHAEAHATGRAELVVELSCEMTMHEQPAFPRPLPPGIYGHLRIEGTGGSNAHDQLARIFSTGRDARPLPEDPTGLAYVADALDTLGGGVYLLRTDVQGTQVNLLLPTVEI